MENKLPMLLPCCENNVQLKATYGMVFQNIHDIMSGKLCNQHWLDSVSALLAYVQDPCYTYLPLCAAEVVLLGCLSGGVAISHAAAQDSRCSKATRELLCAWSKAVT